MLSYLQIRNYAIVEALELEFGDGFTCISGETGAGKSILVGALGLLCGNRADSAAVRQGADKAELSAEFELDDGSPARTWLENAELGDGASCMLRRTLHANGRSRAWINGSAVTVQQLAQLGSLLIEIHGQNEHLRLLKTGEAFSMLDGFANHEPLCLDVEKQFRAWQKLAAERQELLDEAPLDAGDRELLEFQVRELKGAVLSAEAFDQLEKEHRMLARGGELMDSLESARQALQDDTAGASAALHRALRALEPHAALDDDIQTASSLLGEAAIHFGEAERAIDSALSRIDLSPERLAELERTLREQHDLARKHRAQPGQLEQVLEQLCVRLERAASRDSRLAEIDSELEKALAAYRRVSAKLSGSRKKHAEALSERVTGLMQELGMEGGRFEVAVQQNTEGKPSPRGDDRLELSVSANRGIDPGPLRKVASGGELSRISLAVKVAAQQAGADATQVFDEVDAGVGGATASTVGAMIRRLSENGQALCVTHLAQVAAYADSQVNVQKTNIKDGTGVEATLLSSDARIDEVARMLGGQVSQQSRAHAEQLLREAGATRH
jgi:DNA repair protein RecN (Recombination protein N)